MPSVSVRTKILSSFSFSLRFMRRLHIAPLPGQTTTKTWLFHLVHHSQIDPKVFVIMPTVHCHRDVAAAAAAATVKQGMYVKCNQEGEMQVSGNKKATCLSLYQQSIKAPCRSAPRCT